MRMEKRLSTVNIGKLEERIVRDALTAHRTSYAACRQGQSRDLQHREAVMGRSFLECLLRRAEVLRSVAKSQRKALKLLPAFVRSPGRCRKGSCAKLYVPVILLKHTYTS